MLINILTITMALDFLTFAVVVPVVGSNTELNPIMRWGYEHFGLLFVGLLKLVTLVTIIALMNRLPKSRKRTAAYLAIGITAVGILGNITALGYV